MKEIIQFKQLINDEKYYDAHEVLEELWFPIRKTKDHYCLVLKGFINGAVSLELYKRGKKVQSENVHKTYLKYTTSNKILETRESEKFIDLKLFMDSKFNNIIS